jgi:hypothetical protein
MNNKRAGKSVLIEKLLIVVASMRSVTQAHFKRACGRWHADGGCAPV